MKKVLSSIMLLAAAAMAFSSCNKEELKNNDDQKEGNVVMFHITASTPETKSVFGTKEDNAYPTLWTANKNVAFSRDEAKFVEGTPNPVEGGKTATFDVELPGEATEGTIYAFSPKGVYDSKNPSNNVPGFTSINSSNHDVYLIIPSEQTPLSNSVDEAAQAIWGSTTYSDGKYNLDMSFSHVVAYGKMAISNFAGGDIKSVEIIFPEAIAGNSCKYNYSTESITNANVKSIIINPTNVDENVFWFALAPTEGTTGEMKIVVTDDNNDTYTKTIDLTKKALPFVKGRVSSFTANFKDVEPEVVADAIFTISTIADANEWENSKAYNISADDNGNTNITISYSGGGNNGKYYISDESWRLYNGGGMTVKSPDGILISRIEISKSEGELSGDGYDNSTAVWSGSANSVKLDAKATTKIQKIKVWFAPEPIINVTGVALNKETTSINVEATETLTAIIAPENATNKNVTWASNNENVATVVDGVVTGIAAGNAKITVTTEDGGFTASCDVTVKTVPVISEIEDPETVGVDGDVVTIEYSILNPVEGVSIVAAADDEWVNSFDYSRHGEISFAVDANEDSKRETTVTLSYSGAADVSFTVKQDGAAIEWSRVTTVDEITSGGTFIIGYEATAKSGKIIPMKNTGGTATTSAAGYMAGGDEIDMATVTTTADYEFTIVASTSVTDAVCIKCGDNFIGNTNTKNNCKLFTEEANTTAFGVTVGTNDVFTFKIAGNETYHTLQYNTSSPRFAVYGGTQKNLVLYKKN